MSSPEDYVDIYENVAIWAREPSAAWWSQETPAQYLSPLLSHGHQHYPAGSEYYVKGDVLDPLVPDLKDFWANTAGWVTNKWGQLASWFGDLNIWIETLWNSIIEGMLDAAARVKDEIMGLGNYIANIATWGFWALYEDISSFTSNLFKPITTWYGDMNHWIFRVSEELIIWLSSIKEAIWGALVDTGSSGVSWLVGIKDAIWGSIVDAYTEIVDWLSIIKGAIWGALVDTADTGVSWLVGIKDAIWGAIVDAYTEIVDWLSMIKDAIWGALVDTADSGVSWLSGIRDVIWDAMITAIPMVGPAVYTSMVDATPGFIAQLQDTLLWLWDNIKTGFIFVVADLIPAAWEAASGALGALKDEFTNLIGLAYDEIMDKATALVPITPERSVAIAAGMFGSAVGFGALAHGMALAVEAIPNIKYMGVHYLSAFVARMGSFGSISSATMGVIAALAIREPFTYYMNSILRPAIPDEKLLIEFRSKREIDFDQFKAYMKYHGYTDKWIEKIDSWLWKDPRLFEILYCADVTVPPKEWLERKFERAGYEDIDIPTLVKVVERRTTQSPRIYYTTSLRRNFRHGFITERELEEGIQALEMAEDAIDWIKRTGYLDNSYEVNQDMVTSFRTAYRNDIITLEECGASLSAIGIPADRVDALIELERVRKQPRILAAERKEIETQWRAIQTQYSRVYIESFRRGLIQEAALAAYLTAIGITGEAANMTARHEAIKLLPKAKPDPIPIPLIPSSPTPPVYDA